MIDKVYKYTWKKLADDISFEKFLNTRGKPYYFYRAACRIYLIMRCNATRMQIANYENCNHTSITHTYVDKQSLETLDPYKIAYDLIETEFSYNNRSLTHDTESLSLFRMVAHLSKETDDIEELIVNLHKKYRIVERNEEISTT